MVLARPVLALLNRQGFGQQVLFLLKDVWRPFKAGRMQNVAQHHGSMLEAKKWGNDNIRLAQLPASSHGMPTLPHKPQPTCASQRRQLEETRSSHPIRCKLGSPESTATRVSPVLAAKTHRFTVAPGIKNYLLNKNKFNINHAIDVAVPPIHSGWLGYFMIAWGMIEGDFNKAKNIIQQDESKLKKSSNWIIFQKL